MSQTYRNPAGKQQLHYFCEYKRDDIGQNHVMCEIMNIFKLDGSLRIWEFRDWETEVLVFNVCVLVV